MEVEPVALQGISNNGRDQAIYLARLLQKMRREQAALTPEQAETVSELAQRDHAVRQHEEAHISAAGPYARSGPIYQYKAGPDQKSYAVAGEVKLDTSIIEGHPEQTISKMQLIRAAALAPADPSDQDRRVAAQAEAAETEARAELSAQGTEARSNRRPVARYRSARSQNVSQSLDIKV